MVAERRSSSQASAANREKARSRSPAPGKKSGERSNSASETSAGQDTPAWGGLLLVVGLVTAVGGMVVLGFPRNISSGAGSDATDGAGVNLMGFSGLEVDAFFSSLTMILVSEVGDKTFFIAAVLAMKYSRAVVLGGALGALALMTVLSAIIGEMLTKLIPHQYTHYAAVFLFVVFGVKLLKDAREMKAGGPSEELEEVEAELSNEDRRRTLRTVLWQAFILTFLAEWGDRSQVSTIALAAKTKMAVAVTAGGVLGHACCTSLAVVGGRLLAKKISERTVTLAGGALFLIFAVHGMLQDPTSSHND